MSPCTSMKSGSHTLQLQKAHTWQWRPRAVKKKERKKILQWGITSHCSKWPSSKFIQTVNAGKGVQEFYTVGGNVDLYSHYGEVWSFLTNSMEVPEKIKIDLPYEPVIPFFGIYPEETIIWKDARTLMFTAALLTIVRTWKQPKCPLTKEWIKNMWYIYTMEYYSAKNRNEIVPFVETWMNLGTVIQGEISHKEKSKYCIISLICGI